MLVVVVGCFKKDGEREEEEESDIEIVKKKNLNKIEKIR